MDRSQSADSSKIAQYSVPIGLVFIFNLIVGNGALAMPKAFQDAGYGLGVITVTVLAFTSYISFTFVLESMSAANALVQCKKAQKLKALAVEFASENSTDGVVTQSSGSNDIPYMLRPQFFEISQRVEIGRMASMFLGRWGVRFFYLCLIVYLYGDLAIYAAAVPKSVANVICNSYPSTANNTSILANVTVPNLCWSNASPFWTRIVVYRILVIAFAVVIGPWVFFNITKTKYLQAATSASRWIAFCLMIGFASHRIAVGKDTGKPPPANFTQIGNLFGICVYAFMCHHSLPSVVTPMKSKSHIYSLTSIVYALILGFYTTLSVTGAFAFNNLMDFYTMNFLHPTADEESAHSTGGASWILITVEYFLALFPVFTLSMTFPIVGVTLRNNIQSLLFNNESPDEDNTAKTVDPSETGDVTDESLLLSAQTSSMSTTMRRVLHDIVVPFFVVLPPIFISLATDNVEILASVTGSYAGVGVQYAMPTLLVWGVRRTLPVTLGANVPDEYGSPFRHRYWVYFIFLWSGVTVLVVTVNHILSFVLHF